MSESDLQEMRRDALDDEARRAFRESARVVERWERDHPIDLAAILLWIDGLRALFGDPPVDRNHWPGSDFRL